MTTWKYTVEVDQSTGAATIVPVSETTQPPSGGGGGTGGSGGFDQDMIYKDIPVAAGASLQSAINNAANGDDEHHHTRLQLARGATFPTSGKLDFTGKRGLTIEGGGTEAGVGHTGGARIKSSASGASPANSIFYAKSGSASASAQDIRFHGLTVEGSNTKSATSGAGDDGEYQFGWCLFGCDDILIDHCISDKTQGDGVYIGDSLQGGSSGHPCKNITVRKSIIRNTGRMGVAVIWGINLVIDDNEFGDMCYSPFDIEPNQSFQGCTDTYFRRNRITGKWSWDTSYADAVVYVTGAGSIHGAFVVDDNIIEGVSADTGAQQWFKLHGGSITKPDAVLSIQRNINKGPKHAGPAVSLKGWTKPATIKDNKDFLSSGTWIDTSPGGNGTPVASGNS